MPAIGAAPTWGWVRMAKKSIKLPQSTPHPRRRQYSCLENPIDWGAGWAAVHGVTESDMTERLHFHFSLSWTGEGNGNPLQHSCLETPREGGGRWSPVGCRLWGHEESDATEATQQQTPPPQPSMASLVSQFVKSRPAVWETQVRSLGGEDPLEKEMEMRSSILAWRTPWIKVPGGLQSMGSQRLRHEWVSNAFTPSIIEKDIATHSSLLAWELPHTEECAGLQAMGSQPNTHILSIKWILIIIIAEHCSCFLFSVFMESLIMLILFMFWFLPHGTWSLSSLIRDGTHTPALEGEVLTTGLPGNSSLLLLTLCKWKCKSERKIKVDKVLPATILAQEERRSLLPDLWRNHEKVIRRYEKP